MNGPQYSENLHGADNSSPPSLSGSELLRVLVVDNDARVRDAIHETLALEADMQLVGESGEAATALSMAHDTDPSVALVDVLLPDAATGLALILGLSRIPGCAVVAMSVRSAVGPAALAAGAVYFTEKAGDIDALLDTVRTAARSNRKIR
jgi:DNA-binding NarL/FixJ family response regulator